MPSSISTVFANRRSTMHHVAGLSLLAASLLFAAPATMLAAPATTTTLTVTNAGGTVITTAAQLTAVTVSAQVHLSGNTNLTSGGTVSFFDSGALLGSAQVIKSGTNVSHAIIRLIPGVGAHSYTAQFLGTTAGASSKSTDGGVTAKTLSVTAGQLYKDSGVLSSAGGPHGSNGYTITDTLTFLGSVAPTGAVTFRDTSAGNHSLGQASFGPFTGALVPQTPRAAVTNPLIATVGDFKEDGYPDLVYTSSPSDGTSSGTVSVALNNTGTLAAPSPALPVGNYPLTLAVGDFNNDGHLDVAVANLGDGTVSILTGSGTGTFAAALAPISVGLDPFGLAVGDFNNDGKLDLAVANLGNHSVTVLAGVGDGTFTTPGTTLQVGQAPGFISVADFDQDGNADLAVANVNDGTVSIFYGDGTGAFTTGPVVSAGSFPATMAVADFDGNGFPDIAVTNQNVTGTVTILSGAAGRTFTTTATLTVGEQPYGVVAGNLLGNGHIDLAVTNLGNVSILPGQAGGTFAAGQLLNSDFFGSLGSVSVADFNGDGALDLAVPNYDLSTTNLIDGAKVGTAVSNHYTFNSSPANHNISVTYTHGTADAYPSIAAATISVAR